MKAAPALQSLAAAFQQIRLQPLIRLGFVLPRPAVHVHAAPPTALRIPAGNTVQNRGRAQLTMKSMGRDPSDEDEDRKPPWKASESYRYVYEDDPTFEPYISNPVFGFVCKTPEQFSGQRLSGAYEGTFRIQFTLPGKDDEPKTVELKRSIKDNPSTKDNPSFGAVKVKIPLGIEVEINMQKRRLVVTKIRVQGYARRANIRTGDIIRAVSLPEGARCRTLRSRFLFWQNIQDSENGMMMLDGKFPTDYYAAVKDNVESKGLAAEVVLLIERPSQDRSDDDDDWWRLRPGGGFGAPVMDALDGLTGRRKFPKWGYKDAYEENQHIR